MYFFFTRRRGFRFWILHTRPSKKAVYIAASLFIGSLTVYNILFNGTCLEATNDCYFRCSDLLENLSLSSTTLGRSNKCPYVRPFDTFIANGWTNFPLIVPSIEPNISCEERKMLIAVVVNSAASDEKHRLLRMTIRKTWGNSTVTQTKHKWRLFFALGASESEVDNLKNLQESSQYNDVVIGNFKDTYRNVVIKTFMSHVWVYSRISCMYVLKADDDVYIRVSQIAEWFVKQGLPIPFYGGHLHARLGVVRDLFSKWCLSWEVYNETSWPPFSQGSFQVVSTVTLPQCFFYTQFVRKPFFTDDAYFGVMARDLGMIARQIDGFRFSLPQTDSELKAAVAFGHNIDVFTMLKYHARYNKL